MQKKERIPGAIHERNYIYNFHFHLIWVTKYRNPAFTTPELVDDLKGILAQLAGEKGIAIEEMEVMPDHVHLLVSFKPKYAPADIVKYLKGHSAKRFFELHPEIRDHEFWGRAPLEPQLLHEHPGGHEPGSGGKVYPEPVFQVGRIPLLTMSGESCLDFN